MKPRAGSVLAFQRDGARPPRFVQSRFPPYLFAKAVQPRCARRVMRWIFVSLIAALLAAGVYLGSALVFVQGLVEAVRAGDAAAVVARTDLVRVRHSLVDQIVAGYLKQLGRDHP